MSQSLPMQPGIGFPPDSQTDLLRKLVWNTWYIATYGTGGGGGGGVTKVAVPANSGSAGAAGQVAWDDSYFYAYIAGTGWRRTSLNDWA